MIQKGYSKRKRFNRKPYQILVIVCEGGKTERKYFDEYKEQKSGLKIETPNSTVTDPINLVKFAKHQITKYALNFQQGDRVWCVFDVDHHTDQEIQKARTLAGKDVQVCLSNPSFELWYLLHFCYYNSRITNQDLFQKLKKYIPTYQKNKDFFSKLIAKRNNAIKHAKKLNKMHESNGIKILSVSSNPSTQVFKLVEYILKTIEINKSFKVLK
jgi:RloB-like protein